MRKTLTYIFITSIILFSLSYQSLLIDRSVSQMPFTPNIFVSPSSVENTSSLHNNYPGHYYRQFNDSITIYYTITKMAPSFNNKVTGAIWEIKYKNMNAENLLTFLDEHHLFLFTELDENEDFFLKKEVIFLNEEINQYLVGFFNKENNSYCLKFSYPNVYTRYENKHSFKKNFMDLMIGAPR